MKVHHVAWLRAHPERSREWLTKMIADGFDVHHIDLDHSNNEPANLALIEAVDHMRLHGLFALVRPNHRETVRKAAKERWAKASPEERSKHGRMMAMARIMKQRKAKRVARAAAAPL